MSGTPGPISFLAMDRYAIRYGITGDEFERFCLLIRAMDGEYSNYLKIEAKRQKMEGNTGRKK